jgi:hypothetical protein
MVVVITTRDLLEQQIAGILAELEARRAEIVPLERELASAQKALAALDPDDDRPRHLAATGSQSGQASLEHWKRLNTRLHHFMVHHPSETMKDLVRRALRERFPEGAKAAELVELFNREWGRPDVIRSSLSPQLSRLKKDGEVTLDGEIWKLATNSGTPIEDASTASGAQTPKVTAMSFVERVLGSAPGQLDLGGKTNNRTDQK